MRVWNQTRRSYSEKRPDKRFDLASSVDFAPAARTSATPNAPTGFRDTSARPQVAAEPVAATRPAWWEWLLLAETLILAAFTRWRWWDFDLDDAFITYTYARGVAQGEGFVFAGQKALGTTTPLFTLLLAGPAALGLDLPTTAKALGLVAALVGCVLVFLLARATVGLWAGLLGATLVAVNARHALVSVSGMETSLYTTICLGACLAFLGRRELLTAFLCSTACLLRPDGVLLVAVLVVAHLWERRPIRFAPFLAFFLPLALWVAYAYREFGSPIPTSVVAKLAYPEYGSFKFSVALHSIGGQGPVVTTLVAALGIVGVIYAVREAPGLLPVMAWTALYLVAFLRAPNFGWYYVPPIPGLVLALTAGLAAVMRGILHAKFLGRARDPLLLIAAAGAAGALITTTALDAQEYRRFMDRSYGREVTSAYYGLAMWLRKNTPSTAVVATPEVGYIGYYSGRQVLDLAGLCSPQVIPYLRKAKYAEVVHDYQPDYVALTNEEGRPIHTTIRASVWFQNRYRPLQSFPYRGSRYTVYGRRPRRPVTAALRSSTPPRETNRLNSRPVGTVQLGG